MHEGEEVPQGGEKEFPEGGELDLIDFYDSKGISTKGLLMI